MKSSAQEHSFSARTGRFLFVTGVPSMTSPTRILELFLKFGEVRLLRLDSSKRGGKLFLENSAANIRRGFCILQVFSKITYEKILGEPVIQFQGRDLNVSRFRRGPDLQAHYDYLTSKKVVLKKVPTEISLDILRGLLEERFGSITRMYKFEAESQEKTSKKEIKRKTHTFSVEFSCPRSAAQAAEEALIHLPPKENIHSTILVERFYRKRTPATSGSDKTSPHQFMYTPGAGRPLLHEGICHEMFCKTALKLQISDHRTKPTYQSYHKRRADIYRKKKIPSPDDFQLIRFNLLVRRDSAGQFNLLSLLQKRSSEGSGTRKPSLSMPTKFYCVFSMDLGKI